MSEEKIRCPICGAEVRNEPLKTWNFGRWRVSRFQCPECKNKFNHYRDTFGEKKDWYVKH